MDFVHTNWHVDCVRSRSLAAFTEHYQNWCRRKGYNFSAGKAEKIYQVSSDLIAVFPKDESFNARHTKMSKRGSKVLRYALMNVAHNVVKNNATFKAYYDKKMAGGRTHSNALRYCVDKLVRVIWEMTTDDADFNLE